MKGTNVSARQRTVEQGMNIHSIFQTIQGEGPFAGCPAIFVRFAGCNLRCFFCDTDFEDGMIQTPFDLVTSLMKLRDSLFRGGHYRFVLTGGEPMLQPLFEFLTLLEVQCRAPVDIETAGTIWPLRFELCHTNIICSPKTPTVHKEIMYHTKAWKYIIRAGETDGKDGLPNRSTQSAFQMVESRVYRPAVLDPSIIYVQPCDEGDPERNKRNLDEAVRVSMRFGYHLSLQLHKICGLP